jgi:hypothetical protein
MFRTDPNGGYATCAGSIGRAQGAVLGTRRTGADRGLALARQYRRYPRINSDALDTRARRSRLMSSTTQRLRKRPPHANASPPKPRLQRGSVVQKHRRRMRASARLRPLRRAFAPSCRPAAASCGSPALRDPADSPCAGRGNAAVLRPIRAASRAGPHHLDGLVHSKPPASLRMTSRC